MKKTLNISATALDPMVTPHLFPGVSGVSLGQHPKVQGDVPKP